MYRRKLLALNYGQPDAFNVTETNKSEKPTTDENAYKCLVVWLEDQKIRHYKIEDRTALRDIASPEWSKAYGEYLAELNCPYDLTERVICMDWLLGYAVRLEYGDDVEKYKTVSSDSVHAKSAAGVPVVNPMDALNFDDPDFKAGVASLAIMLQVPPHSSYLEQLKAICLLVRDRLSKEALEQAGSTDDKGEHIPLDKTELGFETGDYIMNEVAKILRLLHIKELRDLQSLINQAIVLVQAQTANPKTDSRLGKVGR